MYKKVVLILVLCFSSQMMLSQEELVYSIPDINRLLKIDNFLYYTTVADIRYVDLNEVDFTPQILVDNLDIPSGMEYKDGFLYVAEWGAGKVIKLDLSQPNPSPIDVTLTGSTPNDLLFIGNVLYYSISNSNVIYKYDINLTTQTSETVVITPNGPLGLEFKDGRLYIALSLLDAIYSIDLNDENAELDVFIENETEMNHPVNLEFYNNDLYIANLYSDNILKGNVENEPFYVEEIVAFNGARDLLIDEGILYYCNSAYIYRIDLSTLGTEDVTYKKIKLYPNPTNNEINISNLNSPRNFKLYDSQGRTIKDGTLQPNEKLDVSDLKAGCYFIKFENEDETFRFVKI